MDPVEVRVPGDKSITHRALILGSLAGGASRIGRPLDSADTRRTIDALASMGVEVTRSREAELLVRGVGITGWRTPATVLDCGNSGTTARLLLGGLAGCPFEARLIGDASLQSRPMRRVTEPLAAAGARFDELGDPDRLPVRVHGRRPLGRIEHDSPKSSAQVKSALLLAGITGGAEVRVSEPWRSRDHTERMLRAMGAALEVVDARGRPEVRLDPVARLEPLDLAVPGDPSSAAFFLALGALLAPVRVRAVSLNPTRTGALGVLARMGADVRTEEGPAAAGEPVGDVVVSPASLRGTVVDAAEVPSLLDEVPLLAVLAAVADGETRFEGVAELRVKESDRLAALVTNLRALGVDAEDGPDRLVITGAPRGLSGRVQSFDDHRIAMAFGVLGALPGNDIEIEGREAVEISFPTFWRELDRVTTELAGT